MVEVEGEPVAVVLRKGGKTLPSRLRTAVGVIKLLVLQGRCCE
jgi:hypothetical protein